MDNKVNQSHWQFEELLPLSRAEK